MEAEKPKRGLAIWAPMIVLGLVTCVDSADGSIMRGIIHPVERAFHVGDVATGALFAAPTAINALITMPAGYFADRWHRIRSITLTLLAWSVVCCLGAFSPSFGALLAVRTLTGFGQGLNEPSANSVIADYYRIDRRATAFSIQQCLNYLGVGLGTAVAGAVAAHFGWRASYLVVPLPGFLVALLVVSLLREPARSQSDLEHLGLAADEPTARPPFTQLLKDLLTGLREDVRTILKIPTLRLSLVGVALVLFTVAAIGTWLPTYYERAYHMSQTKATALFAVLIVAAGVPGTLVGGRIADKLVGRIKGGRAVVPAAAAFVATTLFLLSFLYVPLIVAAVLEVVGFFAGTLAVPALRAGLSDVTPGSLRGTGYGAFNLTSVIFGTALAPLIVGAISQALGGDLRLAFICVLPPVYLAGLFMWRARRYIDQDTNRLFAMLLEQVSRKKQLESSVPD